MHGSAVQQQVIHTLMHSVTLEIEACTLACQTLAWGEAHMLPLLYGHRHQFLRKFNNPCPACSRLCTFWGKMWKSRPSHAYKYTHAGVKTPPYAQENRQIYKKCCTCWTSTQTPVTAASSDEIELKAVTMFLSCIKYWSAGIPFWD